MILAGDIGGTKTLLGLFDDERGPRRPRHQARFASGGSASLESMVAEFLDGRPVPERASFAVAGPVSDGRVKATNLDWEELSEAGLAEALGVERVLLLNDLQAVALGITATEPDDLVALAPGRAVPGAPMAVIAPGTGLGEAFLTRDGAGRWQAHPSEGGHCDFGPIDELELELLGWLMGRVGHVSYELVCSGIGLPNLYDFLAARSPEPEPAAAASALGAATDRARAIVELGTASPRCREAVELFCRILGSEAGNLALKVMATGGVYLAGGLAVALRHQLAAGPFLERMRSKGRLSGVLDDVPVHIVSSNVALTGAAVAGLDRR